MEKTQQLKYNIGTIVVFIWKIRNFPTTGAQQLRFEEMKTFFKTLIFQYFSRIELN